MFFSHWAVWLWETLGGRGLSLGRARSPCTWAGLWLHQWSWSCANPSAGTCPMPALPFALPPYTAAMDCLQPTAVTIFVALPQKEKGFCFTGEIKLSGVSTGSSIGLHKPALSWAPGWVGSWEKQPKSLQASPVSGIHTSCSPHQPLGIP